MAPKTRKFILKTKGTINKISEQEVKLAYDFASKIFGTESLKFKQVLHNMPIENLRELLNYLKHDKSVSEKKLLKISSFTPEAKIIQKLYDFLGDALSRGSDMIHDACLSSTPSDKNFTMSDITKQVEIAIGIKSANAME